MNKIKYQSSRDYKFLTKERKKKTRKANNVWMLYTDNIPLCILL